MEKEGIKEGAYKTVVTGEAATSESDEAVKSVGSL